MPRGDRMARKPTIDATRALLPKDDMKQVDFLLLNASNYRKRPIFPYAFVQLSAIASAQNISVKRLDLLNTERGQWNVKVENILDECQPRMIGITLRQVDSIFYPDYFDSRSGQACGTFFPLDETLDLIRILREHTTSPIIMGGIGYTLHAERLFEHFDLDYGMQGDPDSFFEHFEDVVHGRNLEKVLGLIYREGGDVRRNQRGFYHPSRNPEYNEEIVAELVEFYGEDLFRGDNPPQVAVEIMRGCPQSCYFCVEPYAKGREIRHRDLGAIEEELDFLLSQDIRNFWLVCSELNGPGIEFALDVAKIIQVLAERHPGDAIKWSSYGLPTIEHDDLKLLLASGFTGLDLNDIVALDDGNLTAAKLPYRTTEVVRFLQDLNELIGETSEKPMLFMFLGNAFADESSIRRTLDVIEENDLRDNHSLGIVMARTRVFELDGRLNCELPDENRGIITSYSSDGEEEANVLLPTFHCPQYLADHFESPREIDQFLYVVSETLLTNSHRNKKNWNSFLRNNTTPELLSELISRYVAGSSGIQPQAALFGPEEDVADEWNLQAEKCLTELFAASESLWLPVLEYLEIPVNEKREAVYSSYRMMQLLYMRYEDNDQLLTDVKEELSLHEGSLSILFLNWFVYRHNLVLRPDYRDILVSSV